MSSTVYDCQASGVAPAPDSVTTVDPLVASLATVTLPDTEPADVGVNGMVIMRLFPPAIVTGRDSGLMLKPAPITLGCCEMVTTEFVAPVFVSVNVLETLVPMLTLPKLIDALLTLSLPRGAAKAAALRSIDSGTVDANSPTTISIAAPCHDRFNILPPDRIDTFPGQRNCSDRSHRTYLWTAGQGLQSIRCRKPRP